MITGVSTLAVDPMMPKTVYAGTNTGMFKSTDEGITWDAFNNGLTFRGVSGLAIDPLRPTTLYAATDGGGIFVIEQVPPVCVGDCRGAGAVTVDDLITLVNVALGTAEPSACVNGLRSGGGVDVAVIIEAVNNALSGVCAPHL